jgi:hypothetical protein
MKITNLRVTTVTVPLEAPLRHASGAHWGGQTLCGLYPVLPHVVWLWRPRRADPGAEALASRARRARGSGNCSPWPFAAPA